jgi:branched-chain amino acid transport system ATP-binding protein
MALLDITDLRVSFGGLRAVNDVSMKIEEGKLVGLIGPNGAGKTTFIDAITGFVPSKGKTIFDGRDLAGLVAHERARVGLARTWQSLELFDDLTVSENLAVAAERSSVKDFILAGSGAPVEEALRRLDITELSGRRPDELSQGQRKLVGVARALAARPRLMLMDEPAAGLDTTESRELGSRLRSIVDDGTTIFLIDHDMGLVLRVCDYIYVLEFGRLIAEGTPAEVRANERVITAYLGEQARR